MQKPVLGGCLGGFREGFPEYFSGRPVPEASKTGCPGGVPGGLQNGVPGRGSRRPPKQGVQK